MQLQLLAKYMSSAFVMPRPYWPQKAICTLVKSQQFILPLHHETQFYPFKTWNEDCTWNLGEAASHLMP